MSRPKSSLLDGVLAVFQRWMHLPDLGVVEIALAAVAANMIDGDPVWLLLVGPPSGGKTEVLNSLLLLPRLFPVATLTEAALLSGTPEEQCSEKATGGLLREIGKFGILILKDFTSILSMNRDKRQTVLAALREIHDGAWTRKIGIDGGLTLDWHGKVGLIGGVTSSIDSHHGVMSAMGQRFALYRLPEIEGREQAQRAIENTGDEEQMRTDLTAAVLDFFTTVDCHKAPVLALTDHNWLVSLTTLVVKCRSAVERNGNSRDIELIHGAEAPGRLTRMLAQLLRGLQLIGVGTKRRRELIIKVGLDCIPPIRRKALEVLLVDSSGVTTMAVADSIG